VVAERAAGVVFVGRRTENGDSLVGRHADFYPSVLGPERAYTVIVSRYEDETNSDQRHEDAE
jgi:hypothetical protein